MRASPAFQLTIRRFGIWRVAVCLLLASAGAAFLAWLASHAGSAPVQFLVLALVCAVPVLAAGASLLRCRAFSLRWDTQAWWLGPASSMGEEPWRGRLAVAIDLGAWMLLRFERDSARWLDRTVWLPVQRRGLEASWHALRCAVYSARPAEDRAAHLHAAISPESQE